MTRGDRIAIVIFTALILAGVISLMMLVLTVPPDTLMNRAWS